MFVPSIDETQTKCNQLSAMKTRISAFALFITCLFVTFAQPASAQQPASTPAAGAGTTYSLTVVIPNVSKRSGQLRVGLANDEASFSGESFRTVAVEVPASGAVTVTFDSLAAGRYAVRLYQDLNGNQKVDFNGQMPAEPFGFSNVTMLMGPPSFDQCAFDLAENKQIQVGMIEM